MNRLKKRPEALTFSVEKLLELVVEGRLRVPEFQRPIRWQRTQVLELFDSMYRGFPIGNLLLSKGADVERTLRFGGLEVQGRAMGDALLIVDGQQRVNALAAVLLHPDKSPRGGNYALWFDLDEEELVFSQKKSPPVHWLPLNVVADSVKLLTFLNDWPLRNERKDLVKLTLDFGKAIREYPVPAYAIEGEGSREVLPIVFERVNQAGVRMRKSEVFDALNTQGAVKPSESACRSLHESTGFGLLDGDIFLRCLKMVSGRALREEISGEPPSRLRREVEATYAALRRSLEFLIDDADVAHYSFLPYQLPLTVLPVFFHHYPDPHPRTRDLLGRWVWRGALSGKHSDNNDATLSSLRELIDGDEHRSVERLLASVPKPAALAPLQAHQPWSASTAKTKAAAAAMVSLRVGLQKGDSSFDLDRLRVRLTDDETGKAKPLSEAFVGVDGAQSRTSAHMLLVLDKNELRELPSAPAETLARHAIDELAAKSWREGHVDAFVERRAQALDAHFRRYVALRVGNDDDRPPIAELLKRADEARAASTP